MTLLITTDLHFTDKPKDSYRFGLFDFLLDAIKKYNPSYLLILGDLTDLKDKHSSRLVNQIVDGLNILSAKVPVLILKGNHDYHADPTNPFFNFLNRIKNIAFITKPQTYTMINGKKLLLMPHISDEAEWDNFKPDKRPDFAFIHQTVTGAISESGQRLDGFSLAPLKRLKCPVYAGDVHTPHEVGPVTYVGPPYHIRFGDEFTPRCMILDEMTGATRDIHFDCPRKWTLYVRSVDEILSDKRLREGDQVKVRLELTREEVVEWPVYKDRIVTTLKELKLESFGIELKVNSSKTERKKEQSTTTRQQQEPKEVLTSFCKREKISKTVRLAGLNLLS